MFRFASAQYLLGYLVVPLLALFFWYAFRARKRVLLRFGTPRLIAKLSQSVNRRGRHWKAALVVVASIMLVTALARPQFGTRLETVTREGQDIVVALDVSSSMLAEDIAPNRLEKAKHAVGTLIERLRGDRIGLVAFAGEAFVQCPLTLDYGAARMFLNSMGPELIPVPGTALASALRRALQAFDEGETKHKVLILITDGEGHEGDPREVASQAAAQGVVVYAVGMGSPQGVPIPDFDEQGRSLGFKRDASGAIVTTRLDEETLRDIARTTDGKYFRATPGESELRSILDEVASMDKKELATQEFTSYEEQYQVFVAAALLLLLAEFLIPERRRRQSAWKGRFQ